jgi:hypothetical protein
MHCKRRMGCKWCCQIPSELLCLNCDDWANRIALETHEQLVRDWDKCAEGLKIVGMTIDKSVTQEDAQRLLQEIFAS